jgi:hypothetical protein
MVVAVSDEKVGGELGNLREHGELVDVCGSHQDAGDNPRPADPHVHPETVEGLSKQRVLAKGRFSLETRAAVGAGEQASRQGHRVTDGEGRIVGSKTEKGGRFLQIR